MEVAEPEPPATPLEPNSVLVDSTINREYILDQEQGRLLPVEDPEAQALRLKYKGNKIALEHHAQLKEYELKAENLRRQVEEIEPIAQRWKETRDKYPSYCGDGRWSFAYNRYEATNYEQYKSRITELEHHATVIRDFLTGFE